MIPSFLEPTEAQKILLIGKSINFLREVCKQKLSEMHNPREGSIQKWNLFSAINHEQKFYTMVYHKLKRV